MDAAGHLAVLESAIRLMAPLLFACLAGLWSERAGVVDIGLEGKLLAGAFAAASMASLTGSAFLGLLAALVVALVLGLVHGYGAIDRGGDQIVCGMAINMIALGGTALAGAAIFGEGGRTPALATQARFEPLILGLDSLTWLAFALVPATMFIVFQTRFGLRLRACGESPRAVEAAGVSVRRVRYAAVAICGMLCGLGGASLALTHAAGFLPGMSAGKGFMALAALVFAKWRPGRALFVCLMFGFFEAISIRLPGATLPGIGPVPTQAIQALPYLMTVILSAGFIGRATPPAAAGKPFRGGG